MLQKRALRIIHNVGYLEHTNSLFLQSNVFKCTDIVECQTAQVMFKAQNKLLPGNIQKLFSEREGGYNLRGIFHFKIHSIRTTRKSFCISICGVKLWNRLNVELKQCPNKILFKLRFRETVRTWGVYVIFLCVLLVCV